MIYDVTHLTSYTYGVPVDLAHHLLHLTPRAGAHQALVNSQIVTAPPAARNVNRIDHFGNVATWLVMAEPHQDFAVQSRATVEVKAMTLPDHALDITVDEARQALGATCTHDAIIASEFTHASPFIGCQGEIDAYAARFFAPDRSLFQAARDLIHDIHEDFAYVPGATAIATPVGDVLTARQGVCQDFAHVAIAACRAQGLAARYVSGYIRTYRAVGAQAFRGADASHAWIEVWLGGDIWVGLDPTNDLVVADEHITLAIGRDFGDVSPVSGVILGGGKQHLHVAVTVSPREDDA